MKFVVDENAGRLARWLRLMGYDTRLFSGRDDGQMIKIALTEGRTMLTRDRQILRRRLVTSGKVKAVLLHDDNPWTQLQQVMGTLKLEPYYRPFSICLECNEPLVPREREAVRDLVPVYVFQTQSQYTQCPKCRRVYWRGTHWEAMNRQLKSLRDATR
ncbi:MAG: Mut7-C RNAse domain-containing protein [Dehalococcoidia bacterium]|nr:Mut7-C RNAse domain-containing protein [Dehalococcoidia bacterium]